MNHKEGVKNAVQATRQAIYEAQTLREVAHHLAGYRDDLDYLPDFDCEEVSRQVEVLNNIVDERISSAMEALDVVNEYFLEKPTTKRNIESTKPQPVRQELIASAAVVSGKVQ